MSEDTTNSLTLHGYFRSSAAYRVRIALSLKGLEYRHVGVHLVRNGGEQHSPTFRRLNPLGLVPVLDAEGFELTQSLAISEYLDERYPAVPLLPRDLRQRARARQFALTVACDIHPLNNPRLTGYLVKKFGATADAKQNWMRHWMQTGFAALEQQLASDSDQGMFCVGERPTIADCCLVPQVFNARRFGVDLNAYPRIAAIAGHCEALPAFIEAHPAQQPDAE